MVVTKKRDRKKIVETAASAASDQVARSPALPPLDEGIGARIRLARERRGWTQNQLSTRSRLIDTEHKGIARTVIVGYEAGTHKPGAREIRLLCEALQITPNWLLFGQENPFETLQPSVALVRGSNELVTAMTLAFTILLLRPHERDTISSLVLSLGGREVGDLRLSGLSIVATWAAAEAMKYLQDFADGDESSPQQLSIRDLITEASRAFEANVGTKLRLNEDTDQWEGEWLYKDPE
ncbi:MAG: helix-turn-helix transcriptional regulator [Rhodocyclales bacterium]|nr:helix-turn-helix transcriptional regulator [Rhodocyclales bacterium]